MRVVLKYWLLKDQYWYNVRLKHSSKKYLGLLRRSDPDARGHVAVRLEEDRHVQHVDVLAEIKVKIWKTIKWKKH